VLAVQGRRIILGVTGSIAAYKAAELLRALRKEGADVRVVMTDAATHFVAPLTFEVLSGRRVLLDLWESPPGLSARLGPDDGPMSHLESTRADLVLVAPATANIIGKAACGIGDDLLSSTLLAAKPPVLLAPAMNVNMLESPAVQENLARLRSRGWRIVEPEEGELACGVEGAGRLASIEVIMAAAREALVGSTALAGKRVLVTAGRTEEPIDPVRYISNRSSGKMGFALAAAARDRGAEVVLVAGATSVEPPGGVELVQATTAEAMADAVEEHARGCRAVLMAAAVADFRPAAAADTKIRRSGAARPASIAIEYTSDVLKRISGSADGRVTVGFSLELESDRDMAAKKLEEKKLDLIVMNNPAEPGCDFGSDFNKVTFIYSDGRVEELPLLPKRVVAERLLDRVEGLLETRGGAA
jgi:phosphopantothenoylcysteine decarboxylase/phosphopantothenate--cysteine ligase